MIKTLAINRNKKIWYQQEPRNETHVNPWRAHEGEYVCIEYCALTRAGWDSRRPHDPHRCWRWPGHSGCAEMSAGVLVWQVRWEYSPAWRSQPPVAAEVTSAASKHHAPLRQTQTKQKITKRVFVHNSGLLSIHLSASCLMTSIDL